MAVSADGSLVAAGSQDNNVYLLPDVLGLGRDSDRDGLPDGWDATPRGEMATANLAVYPALISLIAVRLAVFGSAINTAPGLRSDALALADASLLKELSKESVVAYVKAGGGLVLLGPPTQEVASLFGVSFLTGQVVFDPVNSREQDVYVTLKAIADHPVTTGIASVEYRHGAPLALPPGAVPLIAGNRETFAETAYPAGDFRPGPDELRGSQVVVLAALEYGKGRVVIYGRDNPPPQLLSQALAWAGESRFFLAQNRALARGIQAQLEAYQGQYRNALYSSQKADGAWGEAREPLTTLRVLLALAALGLADQPYFARGVAGLEGLNPQGPWQDETIGTRIMSFLLATGVKADSTSVSRFKAWLAQEAVDSATGRIYFGRITPLFLGGGQDPYCATVRPALRARQSLDGNYPGDRTEQFLKALLWCGEAADSPEVLRATVALGIAKERREAYLKGLETDRPDGAVPSLKQLMEAEPLPQPRLAGAEDPVELAARLLNIAPLLTQAKALGTEPQPPPTPTPVATPMPQPRPSPTPPPTPVALARPVTPSRLPPLHPHPPRPLHQPVRASGSGCREPDCRHGCASRYTRWLRRALVA